MIWMFCGVFIVGFLIGVVFMALLAMAKDPETRPAIKKEGLQGRLADLAGD